MNSLNNVLKLASALLALFTAIILCSSCSKAGNSTPEQKQNQSYVLTATNDSTSSEITNIKSLDNTCIGWGVGKTEMGQRPSYAESCNQKYKDYNALFVGEDNKKVYMTFDEGYENGYTAPILDTLKEKGVKAVFFLTYDYVKRNPELVKRMIVEGHSVGNHSWSHPSMPSKSIEDAEQEIKKLHDYVKNEFNYEMTLFRFPMGEYSTRALAICKNCGYKSVFWSFAYVDWKTDAQPPAAEALKKAAAGAHNGAIYLLHAVSSTNNAILGQLIDNVEAQGYTWSEFKS
ncbi:MAG: polysaccharide deacetylase family protein [Oscillospiraceae bacterium]|nr:polysaccharide deacetylase family protein [Oscillospiraceae bacterium]